MVRIPIVHLSEGWHRMRLAHSVGELELAESPFRGQVEIEIQIERQGRQYLVLFETAAEAELCCDRCLEVYTERLVGTYSIFFAPEEPVRLPAEEFRLLRAGDRELDVTDDVRQTVLLSLPLKQLCHEDCRGLCPECGVNLNLEPHRSGCPREVIRIGR